MLAQVLPGIRDVRVPFTGGVLWIVLAWLMLADDITRVRYPELFNSIDSLGDALQPLGVGASLTLTAYLVGAALEFTWAIPYKWLPRLSVTGERSILRLISDRLDQLPDDEIEILAHCKSFSIHRLQRDRPQRSVDMDPSSLSPRSAMTADLLAAIKDELDLAATRLLSRTESVAEAQGDSTLGAQRLFDVYDRLRA
ncbi:MAG TPA: hypothetical protein VF520_03960 [Thermoleophilaceae bacterium]|jgi:hypothetical protein